MQGRLQLVHQSVAQTRLQFTIFKFNFCPQDDFGNRTQEKENSKTKRQQRGCRTLSAQAARRELPEGGEWHAPVPETQPAPPASSESIQ